MFVCLLCCLVGVTALPAAGASHQVCLPTAPGQLSTPPEQAGTLLINEVLLFSKRTWSCPGASSVPSSNNQSWLELYNPQSLSFNLYIARAAIDGGPNMPAMYLPFGTTIAAHGFLTIFPDANIIFPSGAPETFTRRLLFNGTVIDQITIPAKIGPGQPYEGYSYARIPDGASKWVITNSPTIGSSNILPTPTPKPTRTPKPTAIKKTSSGGKLPTATGSKTTSTHASTTITGASTDPPAANGSQPAWSQMQLPATTTSSIQTTPSAAAALSAVDATATSPPTHTSNGDILRNTLIIVSLGTALAGALLWWRRRRFKHP